jgi:exopolyphosphatase/pppGpp-phosphohydrolase
MVLTGTLAPRSPGSPGQLQSLLEIGDRMTVVAVHRGTATDLVLELPIGAGGIAEQLFRHDSPRPAELEAAIDAVEDQVMRVTDPLPKGSALRVSGSFAGEIRDAVNEGDPAGDVVGLDEVEQLFQRLASVSLGQPAGGHGLPAGNGFVAAVLILREFMHHLGFAEAVFALKSG